MLDRGYLRIGTLRGIPIRLHWSILLGCLVISGLRFAPTLWIAFFFLVLVHEIGHAVVVRAVRHRTLCIDITGFGGMCRWTGNATPFERSAIAWGGVAAQLVLLVPTFAIVTVLGSPSSPTLAEVADVFTRINLLLIALNLIPFPPFDGVEAWKILRNSRVQTWFASIRHRITNLLHSAKQRRSNPHKGHVVDFDKERKKREHDAAQRSSLKEKSPNELANELIRLSEQAARARRKRDEN